MSAPTTRRSSRATAVLAALSVGLTACSVFLRQGFVEDQPAGRTLVLPAQTGQHEAQGWTKTMEPTFVQPPGQKYLELRVVLSRHVQAAESYLPTPCDEVVLASDAAGGFAAPLAYELQGGGREVFVARFAPRILEKFATDDGGDITLCNYRYRFGGRGLATLLR